MVKYDKKNSRRKVSHDKLDHVSDKIKMFKSEKGVTRNWGDTVSLTDWLVPDQP